MEFVKSFFKSWKVNKVFIKVFALNLMFLVLLWLLFLLFQFLIAPSFASLNSFIPDSALSSDGNLSADFVFSDLFRGDLVKSPLEMKLSILKFNSAYIDLIFNSVLFSILFIVCVSILFVLFNSKFWSLMRNSKFDFSIIKHFSLFFIFEFLFFISFFILIFLFNPALAGFLLVFLFPIFYLLHILLYFSYTPNSLKRSFIMFFKIFKKFYLFIIPLFFISCVFFIFLFLLVLVSAGYPLFSVFLFIFLFVLFWSWVKIYLFEVYKLVAVHKFNLSGRDRLR